MCSRNLTWELPSPRAVSCVPREVRLALLTQVLISSPQPPIHLPPSGSASRHWSSWKARKEKAGLGPQGVWMTSCPDVPSSLLVGHNLQTGRWFLFDRPKGQTLLSETKREPCPPTDYRPPEAMPPDPDFHPRTVSASPLSRALNPKPSWFPQKIVLTLVLPQLF